MRKCEYCGAFLDAGERCDCNEGKNTFESVKLKKTPAEEVLARVERMTLQEYQAYLKRMCEVSRKCNMI